jgi:hypothetical protein
MSVEKPPILVFFVPGVMGSSLFLQKNTFGRINQEEIWGKNFGVNISLFHGFPNKLNPIDRNDIQAGEVISSFTNIRLPQRFINKIKFPVKDVEVYGTLMQFCRNNIGLRAEDDFFPFAYNWLADNQITANKLAEFIREKDPKGNYLYCLIAHSMGGIVSRLMLANPNNRDLAEKTKLLFQIATPVRGSAKAYYALKRYPILHPVFDQGWQFIQNPQHRADLSKALQSCYSLYQLLPSQEINSLYDEHGNFYASLDPNIWHEDQRKYVDAAIKVHQKLANFDQSISSLNRLKNRCFFSDQHSTPLLYKVDSLTNYDLSEDKPKLSVFGDDTVTCASAIADSNDDSLYLIKEGPTDHMGLCQNQKVYDMIKAEFRKELL